MKIGGWLCSRDYHKLIHTVENQDGYDGTISVWTCSRCKKVISKYKVRAPIV